jgi:hypothetical protein
MDVERLDAPSPLPTPESFMDTLDPIYRSFPTYRSLDEHLRGELRILLAEEARRWIKEDVPAGAMSLPVPAPLSFSQAATFVSSFVVSVSCSGRAKS